MIILDGGHRSMEAQLDQCFANVTADATPIDMKLTDFDEAGYRLTRSSENGKSVVEVSIRLLGWEDLKNCGAGEVVVELYKKYPSVKIHFNKVQGYPLTLSVDLDALPAAEAEKKELSRAIGLLRRNLVSAPFRLAFEALAKDEMQFEKPVRVQYRKEEVFYVFSGKDRAVVCYSINVPKKRGALNKEMETTDSAVCRVFLQEFDEVRKRSSFNAPIAIFTEDLPLELKELGASSVNKATGYIQFVFFKRHIEGGKIEKALTNIQQFRNYLDYHIKCAKAYMHTRMRNSTSQMLQVLNRAKPDKDNKDTKTMGGKAFKRS